MASGSRMPTWRERENNKRRERRRRAIAAKVYSGLRAYGNYDLPKHCDNNEVLKALCREAGWVVEPDGTTYRKGLKPPTEGIDAAGTSTSPSPFSSYHPSACTSYNLSPASSSFASPASSSYITNSNNAINITDANSLIPWLKNLSSASSPSSSSNPQNRFYLHSGSISAPVTPPLSSPTARTPHIMTDWGYHNSQPPWVHAGGCVFLPNSTPPSPGRQIFPDPGWLAGLQIPTGSPSSPTFSLVSSNPFGMSGGGSSRMLTPGQSGTCSPVTTGMPRNADIQMTDDTSYEFAFGSSINANHPPGGLVKPWEGERIHEEFGSDDLELTLGSSKTRADTE